MNRMMLICSMVFLLACKKENTTKYYSSPIINNPPCKDFDTTYDAPNLYKAMFSYLPQYGMGSITVKTYSNNGLTESITISNNNRELSAKYNTYMNGCDSAFHYKIISYKYLSSLYGYNFNLVAGYLWSIRYCFNFSNKPGLNYYSTWLVDSSYWAVGAPNFMLRFKTDSISSGRLNFALEDNVSTNLTGCNDCFTNIGNYKAGNKIYNNVYRLRNDYQPINAKNTSPYFLWIDKDYGIIQFQLSDSTIWNFDYK